ncbi:MAG: hypothetical protein FJY85_10110 [Deltaproteobacteria bacterium]|nr:hypothetical protein [Deltaproteobacteria bacterium]
MQSASAKQLRVAGFKPSWSGEIETWGRSQADEPERGSARIIQIQTAASLPHEVPDEYRVPLRTLSGIGLTLFAHKPVTVHVSKGEALWFAENHRLDVYATGETAQEAISQFKMHLLRFYRHYQELKPSEAMGEALRLKTIFEESFVEASV